MLRAFNVPAISAILLAATLLTAPPALADDLDALLARPVSPGALGLLVPYAKDPRVQARWRAGLEDPSPMVRATAARLLLVGGVTGALPRLGRVVAAETDSAVVVEAARAVLLLGTGPVEDLVVTAALRLSEPKLAVALAESRGAAALERLPMLRPLLKGGPLREFVQAAGFSDASALDRLAALAVGASDAPLWLELLSFSYDNRTGLAPERLLAALKSPSAELRAYTWWHVAVLAASDAQLPDALVDPGTDRLDGIPPNLAFGRELAGRVLKKAKVTPFPLTPLDEAPAPIQKYWRTALATTLFNRLHKIEREALRVEKAGGSSELDRKRIAESKDYPRLRTIADLPSGYVADVLAISGCVADHDVQLPGAMVRYSTKRHLQELRWVGDTPKGPCAQAARAILAAGLLPAPASLKPGEQSWIVLPVGAEFLGCLAEVPASDDIPVVVGKSAIAPPKKVRHVNPTYPPMAIKAGRQGLVVIDAQVSPRGCVNSAEVAIATATDFDLEAVRAVSGWAFTPTLVDGRPYSVLMTVTVQFSLQ